MSAPLRPFYAVIAHDFAHDVDVLAGLRVRVERGKGSFPRESTRPPSDVRVSARLNGRKGVSWSILGFGGVRDRKKENKDRFGYHPWSATKEVEGIRKGKEGKGR